jgi:hypothetical protein
LYSEDLLGVEEGMVCDVSGDWVGGVEKGNQSKFAVAAQSKKEKYKHLLAYSYKK